MPQSPEMPLVGTITTTSRVNLRQGAPTTKSPILRKLEAGTVLAVSALAIGEPVAGNAHWFQCGGEAYVWAGACGALQSAGSGGDTTTPAVVSPRVRLVDLYHGDAVTSFADARQSGLLGVIHKATTGATGRDDAYHGRRTAARNNGLLWGAYHWGTAAPVADQVANFVQWASPDEGTLMALDYEPTPGNQMTLEMAREFLQRINDMTGRRAVIYGGHLLKQDLGDTRDPFFAAHRLWLAQYGTAPQVQASWSTYWLWQYTDGENGPPPRSVPGIPGNSKGRLDCNHFAGTEADLRAQWA